jgi:cytosine/adenosine deaminase-related metal-dependent hydrolase
MRTILRNASWICTGDDTRPRLARGHVCHVSVLDGCIEAVQDAPVTLPADEVIDLDGCLLTPGLINVHHHFFQSLTRAIPHVHRAASEDWLVNLYPLWAEMTPEDIAAATRNAVAELLLSGTTTSADHAFNLGAAGDERIAAQIDAAQALGIRLHLVRGGLPEISGRVGERVAAIMGNRFGTLVDAHDSLLAQCRADVQRWHDPRPDSMLRFALGPSNIAYTQPALMRDFAALAAESGCGLHAHLHPRAAERALSQRETGMGPVEFLEQAGWMRPGTWFAHCTELDDADIARFAERQVGVAHCPRTVLRLGYRMPRLGAMRRAGVRIAIGADGAASNDGGAFLSDVRLALLLHRVDGAGDAARDWLLPQDALRMATRDAALMLGRPELGVIAPGMRADLAAFDLRGIDCAGALDDPLGGFLLAGSNTRAHLTMVEGRVVVRNGRLVSGDEQQIADDTNTRSRALLARARARYPQLA